MGLIAVMAGMEAPLFSLGTTYILTVFYSLNGSKIKQEVNHVALIFVGAAIVTIPIIATLLLFINGRASHLPCTFINVLRYSKAAKSLF
jgi:ATP-binding cassette subfamily B (MDR/TAP) protein 1